MNDDIERDCIYTDFVYGLDMGERNWVFFK